jgi:hypothetical protein
VADPAGGGGGVSTASARRAQGGGGSAPERTWRVIEVEDVAGWVCPGCGADNEEATYPRCYACEQATAAPLRAVAVSALDIEAREEAIRQAEEAEGEV